MSQSDYSGAHHPCGMIAAGLEQKLSDPRYYRKSIERIHKKYSHQFQPRLYEIQEEGYNFVQAYMDRARLARLLARAVSRDEYRFSPARIVEIHAGDKLRKVYSLKLLDRIVHGAVHIMLAEEYEPQVYEHLYSYIRGRSRVQAIEAFSDYLRAHRAIHPVPKERGLCVLRCDISAYGESIPVFPGAPLWDILNQFFLDTCRRPMSSLEKRLMASIVRPPMLTEEDGCYEYALGIPDGSPISAFLLNIYASGIDKALYRIPGAFYARYGDDILFAHTDPEAFLYGEGILKQALRNLSLSLNQRKTRRFFFNGAGRAGHGMPGVHQVDFLGLTVGFNGTVSLKADKLRRLYGSARQRVHATRQLMRDEPFEKEGAQLCAAVNSALDPYGAYAHPYMSLLMNVVNDRRQLRQIDYNLARLVMRNMLGHASVKGFRTLPYARLRKEWKLRSLEYERNRHLS